MGVRALKNIMLSFMARQGDTAVFDLAYAQYENSVNMSERLGHLKYWYGMMLHKQSSLR
jgi:aminopeptidase N